MLPVGKIDFFLLMLLKGQQSDTEIVSSVAIKKNKREIPSTVELCRDRNTRMHYSVKMCLIFFFKEDK